MTVRVRLMGLALALTLLPVAASGQEKPALRGALDATAYERLPATAGFLVRPASASPMALGMADVLTEALRDAGYSVDPSGTYTLSFQLTGGVPTGVYKRPNLELDGGGGRTDFDTFEFKLRFNMLRKKEVAKPRRRMLLITVSDRDNRLVWEGRASITAEAMDSYDIVATLAPVMIEELGRSVYGRPVP